MSTPRLTVLGLVMLVISAGLMAFYFSAQTSFDIRLFASIASVISYTILLLELKKHAGNLQLIGMFLSILLLGSSIDHLHPLVPFMSIAMIVSYLGFKKYFRQWISETTLLWLDPVFIFSSFGIYVYGNIYYDYGWKGWAFPVIPLVATAFLSLMDFVYGKKTLKYVAEKKLMQAKGSKAPDFCLKDYDGNDVKLSDYNGKRHVLLMFVRNAWCPSCHIMLRTYQRNSEKFREKNILLCAIGPDISDVNKQMASDLGIDFKVLSDEGQKTAMAYRVHLPSEVVGAPEGMPLPASFLVCDKGIIRYTSRADRIGEFLDPNSIFPILESLN